MSEAREEERRDGTGQSSLEVAGISKSFRMDLINAIRSDQFREFMDSGARLVA